MHVAWAARFVALGRPTFPKAGNSHTSLLYEDNSLYYTGMMKLRDIRDPIVSASQAML